MVSGANYERLCSGPSQMSANMVKFCAVIAVL